MKTVPILLSSVILGLTVSSHANAKEPVYFKSPINFAGSGCPSGSASVVNGKNTKLLSINFKQYEAGKNAAGGERRAACNFAVPVHVANGYQVAVLTADWRGYTEGRTEFTRKYFFAGEPNVPSKVSRIDGKAGQSFLFKDNSIHQSMNFSACGEDKILRINSSIKAKSNSSYIKLKNAVKFKLVWRRCK
ncbi:MAG: DUF4360 domain-containing protein [bacterium]